MPVNVEQPRRNDKSASRIERCVISSFRVVESMGFKGEFRQWEHCCGSAIDRSRQLKTH